MNCTQIIAEALSTSPNLKLSQINNKWVKKNNRIRSIFQKLLTLKWENPSHIKLIKIGKEIQAYLLRLDNYIIIGRSETDELYKKLSTRDKIENYLGLELPQSGQNNNLILQDVKDQYLERRSQEWMFRIMEELSQPCYPIFWTLTIDPQNEKIIKKGSDKFKLWTRKLTRKYGANKYCCVTERGEHGRLHYHSLFIFKKIKFSDPNRNRPGRKCLVPEFRGQWPYGFSDPVAIRYSPNDQYGRQGWRWPDLQPTGSPEAVAIYMAGYLRTSTEETNQCRTKTSRHFGLNKLHNLCPLTACLLLNQNPDQNRRLLQTKSPPPKRLTDYYAGKKLYGSHIPRNLPATKIGSVREAAALLTTLTSNPTKTGDYLNPGGDYNQGLNPWKTEMKHLRMGKIF